jgi:hypothetical protein
MSVFGEAGRVNGRVSRQMVTRVLVFFNPFVPVLFIKSYKKQQFVSHARVTRKRRRRMVKKIGEHLLTQINNPLL